MIIADSSKIKDIQKEFSQQFPHLKLKFYKQAHQANEGSRAGSEWNNELTIAEIRSNQGTTDLKIDENMQVQELEGKFAKDLGLNVQVFRESTQGIWLQTVSTDHWTLKAQNEKAEAELTA